MDPLVLYSSTFAGAMLATLTLTPLAIRFAYGRGLLDQPAVRKVHQAPTPRLGGMAIGIAAVIVCVAALVVAHHAPSVVMPLSQPFAILAASIAVFGVGIADDIKSVPSKWKLTVLVAAAISVVMSGVRINELDFGIGTNFQLGSMSWILTIVWIIAVPVSLNFIDGLDGLAAGIGILASLAVAIGAGSNAPTAAAILALALAGSLCGFFRYNFRPARIFMGDSGSLFIGFLLACTSVLAAQGSGIRRGILLPACALAVPLFDAALTIVRRSVIQRRSLFSAECGHVHHRLLANGFSHARAVIVLLAVSTISALLGLAVGFAPLPFAVAALASVVVLIGLFFRFAGSTQVGETILAVRRNRSISRESMRYQTAFDEMQIRFKFTTTFPQWWSEICTASQMLDFTEVVLTLANRDGSSRKMRWADPKYEFAGVQRMRATVPLKDRRTNCQLCVEIEVAAPLSLESAGTALTLFSRLVSEHGLCDLPNVRPAIATNKPAEVDADGEIYDVPSTEFLTP